MDEYDRGIENKSTNDALLHMTDPIQNSEYRDTYLSEITINLSNIWFVYAMNNLPSDDAAADRIFTVNVPGYDSEEKVHIIRQHLLPKALRNIGRKDNDVEISHNAAALLIDTVCGEDDVGVRTVEKAITDVVNKIAFVVDNQKGRNDLLDFNVSFHPEVPLAYPFKLTRCILKRLIGARSLTNVTRSSYIA